MVILKDEWFKHFRTFLKINNLYKEFMECFQNQKFYRIHYGIWNDFRPNYIKVMKQYCLKNDNYREFGAMVLTFSSFKWVDVKRIFPTEFTKKWCTAGFKWGLYCIEHNIEICTLKRFIELVNYWEGEDWIEKSMLTEHEIAMFKSIEEKLKQ